MFIRIVKLSIADNYTQAFLEMFENKKKDIRNFPGCKYLDLYRDKHNTNVFFTYSYWDAESDLEAYRHSALFKVVWAKTKAMFSAKPQAWSVDRLQHLP